MRVSLLITVMGKIDSKKLYDLISMFNANLTDLGDNTMVYGEFYLSEATRIIYHAGLFGNCDVSITHLEAE